MLGCGWKGIGLGFFYDIGIFIGFGRGFLSDGGVSLFEKR